MPTAKVDIEVLGISLRTSASLCASAVSKSLNETYRRGAEVRRGTQSWTETLS